MAKKRRKEPKEVFKEPEFDEVEFMKKEMVSTKIGIITVLYAIPIALISFALTVAGLAILGFGAGVLSLFTLRFLYTKLGIDVKDMEKKAWLGNGALLFFTWLLIWILVLNPPFADLSHPTVRHVELWVQDTNGNWDKKTLDVNGRDYTSPQVPIQAGGTRIKVKANVTDNVEVSSVRIVVKYNENVVNESTMKGNRTFLYNYEYDFTLTQSGGFYTFEIEAIDTSGYTRDAKLTVQTLNPP